MRIAILVAVLGERDAIGTDACEMAAALARQGHDVHLFATESKRSDCSVEPLQTIESVIADPDALLIYHFAFGWPPGVQILKRARCRRIVRYHNVTPPHFFADWSAEYEASCQAGRDEIGELAAHSCELYLGDSPFNVEDFLAAGVPAARTAVLAPFSRLDRLVATPADLGVLDGLCDSATNWLAVGRLAPNKDYLALLDAFTIYLDRCHANARLLVIGAEDGRLARYTAAIRGKVRALHLDAHVQFLRDVDDAVLKAAYLCADVLVSMSQHEGFCVPLVEAMILGVPVIATACGAQPWTLGGAGMVWGDPDPALIATSVERVRQDRALRQLMRERGYSRVASAFSSDVLATRLAGIVETFR